MEQKMRYLELIQKVISRMANNLFYLKGWTITLTSALFALNIKEDNSNYIWLSYFPVFIFWILDGYFLSQERLYRMLYDKVRKLKNNKVDFSMDTSEFKGLCYPSWHKSIFAPTLLMFYLPLVAIMIVYTFFMCK